MTREEASFILANIDRRVCDDELNEALDVAIKALEQESFEDAISRAYIEPIVEELENICVNGDEHILDLLADIKNAPPVTSQSKHEDIAKAFQLGISFGFIDGLANKTQESEDKE